GGFGVLKDTAKGFQLFQNAVNNSSILALNSLGHCYHHGIGIPQDYKKAKELYEMAISRLPTYGAPHNNLGVLYKCGLGCDIDVNRGIELYQKASDLKCYTGTSNLAVYYDNLGNYDQSVKLHEVAIKEGNIVISMKRLALIYEKGLGTCNIDLEKSRDLLKMALTTLRQENVQDKKEIDVIVERIYNLYKSTVLKDNYEDTINFFNQMGLPGKLQMLYKFDNTIMNYIFSNIDLNKKIETNKKLILAP
ncbi:MAG: hypothetical protein Barrevirus34_1, partial [Barrevirus sp.]